VALQALLDDDVERVAYALTCFFGSPVSFEIVARMSDLVGAELFFAI